jgi:hypothetical protein
MSKITSKYPALALGLGLGAALICAGAGSTLAGVAGTPHDLDTDVNSPSGAVFAIPSAAPGTCFVQTDGTPFDVSFRITHEGTDPPRG